MFISEFKENSTNKRCGSPDEIQNPSRKIKISLSGTLTISNDLFEKTNGNDVATEKIPVIISPKESKEKYDVENVPAQPTCNSQQGSKEKQQVENVPAVQSDHVENVPTASPHIQSTLNQSPPQKSQSASSSDFVRKFQKRFDKMNRQDLEEFLMQKCIQSVVHKSEFATMRNKVVEQENKLESYTTKYKELKRQFIDLKLILSKVVKDMEDKNKKVIMPVKITRAVGQQVNMPPRKSLKRRPPTQVAKASDVQQNNFTLVNGMQNAR